MVSGLLVIKNGFLAKFRSCALKESSEGLDLGPFMYFLHVPIFNLLNITSVTNILGMCTRLIKMHDKEECNHGVIM